MSELRPEGGGRGELVAGDGQRLRVVPAPDSAAGLADAFAAGWARSEEQGDWCVDAGVGALAGCAQIDAGAASMSARERRAVLLSRQRARAQAVLAAVEPSAAGEARARARQLLIWGGSGLAHLAAFALLVVAVADLEALPKSAAQHAHLFEAPAALPVELAELPTPIELEPSPPEPPSEPTTPARKRRAKPTQQAAPAQAPALGQDQDPPPYALNGFELSSQGALPAGQAGGEAWGHAGASGSAGPGSGSGSDTGTGSDGPELAATPRGGLVEPEYPPALERRGVEGVVVVKVWIDEHGHVIKAEVAQSSGHEEFDHNALMAAQRQEWTAAQRGGQGVSSFRRYRVRFRLPSP